MTDIGKTNVSANVTNKLRYEAPALVEFGTLREITQTVAGKNNSDGGSNKGTKNRTS